MEKMKTYRKRPLFLFFLCICCFIFLTFYCLLYGRVLQELQNQTLIIDRGFAYITLQHESDPTQLPQTQESLDGFVKKPSDMRKMQIKEALHILGKELLAI